MFVREMAWFCAKESRAAKQCSHREFVVVDAMSHCFSLDCDEENVENRKGESSIGCR